MKGLATSALGSKMIWSLLAPLGLLLHSGTANAQTINDVWLGGTGFWSTAGNWSGGVPNNGVPTGTIYNVLIDNGNAVASSVTLNVSAVINNLTVNSDDSLAIGNGNALTIAGTSITNAGNLSLGSTGNNTELVIGAANVTLSGGGTVTLSNNGANYIFGAATGDTLTNQETIQGAGHIGNGSMTLVNSGTINANQSAGMTIYANGGTTNTGTLEATAGSTLALNGIFTNTGGTISANASKLQLTNATVNGGAVMLTGASTLQLTNGIIHGGSTLTNSATGIIEAVAGTNTLGGTVSNPAGGVLKIDNGATLNLETGSYPTLGAVQLNSTGNYTDLVLAGTTSNVTLSGGTVTLSNNANNYIFGAATGDTLTNQETIQGSGHIGNGSMTLVNSGTINANQSAGMTINASGGTTNTGTLEATAGSTLALNGIFTNTGGKVLANASKLQLTNATVNGGAVTLTGASTLQLTNGIIHGGSTLTNSATGIIEAVAGNNTLGGTVVNPAGGVLKIDNGATLNLETGSYPTLGAVQLNSTGNYTDLVLAGTTSNVTLSGGTVTLSNNANNYIFGAATADTLTNQETIQGAGHIGNGVMTLVNSGTINANQSAGMTINASGGTTNTGTLEATAGSTLALNGTFTNTGGKVLANASKLQLTNATVNGGAVTLTGASTLQLTNGIIHGGSTLTNSATGIIEAVAGTNTLGGTVSNPAGGLLKIDNGATLNLETGSYPTLGAVQLNSTGNYTDLVLAGTTSNVTLSGGTVTLSNNANNYIFGAATADTLTNQETIQGAGHIGNGVMTLVNSGTINANQSAGMTINANGGTTNTGTLEATAGSTLALNGTFTNTGGKVLANASKLQLTNATVNGGAVTLTGASTLQLTNGIIHGGSTLTNSATGIIEAVAGTNTLGGTVSNPAGGLLKIDNGATLNLETGSYPTLGAVQLNSTGNYTDLVLAGTTSNVTLSGGTVTLSNNANNYIFGAATADTLTNQETIQGAGHIGNGVMTLVNSGTINANQSAGMTINANGGTTNTGTLEATAGSTLALNGTFNNTGGKVLANASKLQLTNATVNGGAVTLSGASTLQLTNGTIHGGSTLTNSATGTIEVVAGTNTLGGTVVNPAGGVLKIDNGATLNLETGSYPTLGAVQLNSTGNNTDLVLAGTTSNVTLSGGTVTLSNNANNYIFGAASADKLTNQETIQGAGHIGNGVMTLVNSGTINANQSAGMVIQASGGFTNSGTLLVGSGDTMHVLGGTFSNFSAGTLTGGTYNTAGTLEIDQLGTTGGEIVTNAATIVLNGAGSSIVDAGSKDALSNFATNAGTGTFSLLGGRNFTTTGNFTNNGILAVGSGSTFGVGGALTNFSGTTLTGGTYNVTGTFQFAGANIVTNAAKIVLIGTTSKILNSSTSTNGLANFATNAATGTFSLLGGRSFTTAGNFTNNGIVSVAGTGSTFATGGALTTNTKTMQAAAGSTLLLNGTTVTNTGGTVSANASKLQVTNATVNGGAVTLAGASTLQLNNGTVHGGTLTNSATGTIEAVAGTNTLGGAVNNPAGGLVKIDNGAILSLENGSYPTLGAVQLNSTGTNTDLVVAGANVTLSGGTVTLSNNTNNYIFGTATGNTLTNQETIQGAGHIGNGSMTLVNSGTINANQSAGMAIQANGGFTNSGKLLVGSGDLMHVFGGTFSNYSAGTLTGGTYNTAGTLEIDQLGNTGGEIVTNSAIIVLNGAGSSIVDAGSKDALSNFATNAGTGTFSLLGGRNFTTTGNFTNNGILATGSGSTFGVGGAFTNFAGTTLTGGTYNVTGTLQFAGANIVTNAAKIALTGTASKILNSSTSTNGLANFASNATAGSFSLLGGRSFTTAGSFANAGNLSIGVGSTFSVGGPGIFTQTAGTTTDSGKLSASGGVNLSGGSLFGTGSITGNLQSSGIVTPGTSTAVTGILTDSGVYTQNTAGVLNISIGGTTVGSKFDALNTTTANLGGTLNIQQINGFVPTIGSTFKILNFSSESGQFATVNGLSINSTEHYGITYEGTDVLLTVVSGAAPTAATFSPNLSRQLRFGGDRFALGAGLRSSDSRSLDARPASAGLIARTINEQVDYGSRARSLMPSLQPLAAGWRSTAMQASAYPPAAASSRPSFHMENASRFTSASIGARLNATMADRRAPAMASHFLSMNKSASALPRTNLDGRARLGGKVARGNLQFSLPSLFSRPNFNFSVN